ncbi:MAG: diaminopimelate epimerase [Planctomycetes bacterium]|nr:diaminopimelate epimerase [Planctomycetota bacterium]
MRFTKMHGCGNDYVYLDGFAERLPPDDELPALARALSDRHTGIGADGLILVLPSTIGDARMVMYNADGSASEMCGNGIRCAAKLAWDHRRVATHTPRIETGAGVLSVELRFADEACIGARVDMGRPRLSPAEVPVVHPGPGPLLELSLAAEGGEHRLLAVGMGNPHAVCFVDDPETFAVQAIGRALERHAAFPRRTNVEFVARLADEGGLPVLRQRTWERGSGETQACGTGACATVVAAILDRRIPGRQAIVRLNGGDLRVEWPHDAAAVTLDGPAVTVFAGEYPWTGT